MVVRPLGRTLWEVMMMDGFGMGIGGGFMWLIWLVLILAIVWAIGRLRPGRERSERSSRDLLDERFARGEIDEEEYHKRRAALDS